ncbi:MAG: 2OG-Fe(II) oxygenase [Alphaproteobacteria bacterium]
MFVSSEGQARFPVCADLAQAFQQPCVLTQIEASCGIELSGSYLRIEYCQDTEGFWLEPHTDIREKLFTMLVYLSTAPGSENWGTDIYDENLDLVGTAPCEFNSGLIFLPGADTWHGFHRRPIRGVRRSLIINYVKPDWRSRHELAFPDRPVP